MKAGLEIRVGRGDLSSNVYEVSGGKLESFKDSISPKRWNP
jgi:hypothetical protein